MNVRIAKQSMGSIPRVEIEWDMSDIVARLMKETGIPEAFFDTSCDTIIASVPIEDRRAVLVDNMLQYAIARMSDDETDRR